MKIFCLLATFLLLTSCTTDKSIQSNDIPEEQGSMEVFFCPQQECEEQLVSFLDSAQESIHCAFFDLGLPSVQQTLLEKEKEIEVKVVTDNDYLKKFNHDFVKADKSSLMHDKFCIIDGRKISTGSMNPTENDAHKNNNNLLLIESTILAQNYEAEFAEMWNGIFKKGSKVEVPELRLNGMRVDNYFCPEDACAEQIKEELEKAEKSIHFMTFSFTHEGIANILLLKNVDGIEVKGVMEVRQITEHSQYERLKQNKIEVLRDGNKNNLHHKVFIIDEKVVITGSFNPSENGDQRNDENVIIIENEEIATEFMGEFWKVYGEASS